MNPENVTPYQFRTYKYTIDYEFGVANLWTPVEEPLVVPHFQSLANQCFGIRKSVGITKIISVESSEIPKPWSLLKDAKYMLTHSGGDIIVWDSDGNKIKSEFD